MINNDARRESIQSLGTAIIVVASLLLGFADAQSLPFDLSNPRVPLGDLMSGGPGKDGIPALSNPEFLSVSHASHVRDARMVIGLAIGNEARAYPLSILNHHEIANDAVGGTPVAATWCPLTRSAVVFDRRVGGQLLEFGVSGLLYQSNVVMYDRQSNGLWSQLRMASIAGRHSGTNLRVVPSVVTTWQAWRQTHPETLVLSSNTGHRRNYSRDPYGSYHGSPGLMFPVATEDGRLPAKALVLGVRIGGKTKAYSVEEIHRHGMPYVDTIGTISVLVNPGPGYTAYLTDTEGRLLPATFVYWFAWAAFNPGTLQS